MNLPAGLPSVGMVGRNKTGRFSFKKAFSLTTNFEIQSSLFDPPAGLPAVGMAGGFEIPFLKSHAYGVAGIQFLKSEI